LPFFERKKENINKIIRRISQKERKKEGKNKQKQKKKKKKKKSKKKNSTWWFRTTDLTVNSRALCQLS
jgi:hypothetical protein